MGKILDSIAEWLKEVLVGGIVSNLSGMFDSVNSQVGDIAGQVGATPQGWNATIYNMIHSLSDNVIIPIAGVILAFVMTMELIQMVADKNNMHGDVDTWMFFKWIFKTACAVIIVTNTWNIVMGVFDVGQSVVNSAAGIINADTSIDINSVVVDLEERLMEMDIGPLFGLWFQSLFVGICTWALTICIFIITYGRMIEIYLVTSVAPIPMATMVSKESGNMGQNYLRSLFALAFQAFLIIVCVAIYAALVENIGLIEVMGLAVLPSRLKGELTDLSAAIVAGKDIASDEVLSKHAEWVEELKQRYIFTEENALDILLKETGKVFTAVLEDAGVYKCTEAGRAAFASFVEYVSGKGNV